MVRPLATLMLLVLAGAGCMARRGESHRTRILESADAEQIVVRGTVGRVISIHFDPEMRPTLWRVEITTPGTRFRRNVEIDAMSGRVMLVQLNVPPDGDNGDHGRQ